MFKSSFMKTLAVALMIVPLCDCSSSKSDAVAPSSNAATVSAADVGIQGAKLLSDYTSAMLSVTDAQKSLAQAYGLNDVVKAADTQSTILKSGNLTTDAISKTIEFATSANSAITEKMKEKTDLSSEAKQMVAKALAEYLVGTGEAVDLAKSAKDVGSNIQSYISSLPLSQKASALSDMAAALGVIQGLPSLSQNLLATGKDLIGYALDDGVNTNNAQKTMSGIFGF